MTAIEALLIVGIALLISLSVGFFAIAAAKKP
jgi:uncharacterized protein YneF (UPF0154 family)